MTKHNEPGGILWECDGCDETLATGTKDWSDAKTQLDNAGWKTEKVAGEWLHACPACRKK